MKNTICTAAGVVGSFIASLFGGWDTGIGTLVLFMSIDFLSDWQWPESLKRALKQKTELWNQKPVLKDCVASV